MVISSLDVIGVGVFVFVGTEVAVGNGVIDGVFVKTGVSLGV